MFRSSVTGRETCELELTPTSFFPLVLCLFPLPLRISLPALKCSLLPLIRAVQEATIEDHFYNLNTRLALAPDEWIRNVHRLDKSTTGPLILATTATKAKDLCAQFANRSVDKSEHAARRPTVSQGDFALMCLLASWWHRLHRCGVSVSVSRGARD